MSLQAGSRLGSYQVVASLGAGGMGEVYRGHDPKLGRDVAIKILPPAFAADAERLARFEREARTLAALNHPNIAQIFGVIEPAEGQAHAVALVMELVEGEDLSAVIGRGAVPLADALAIARQVAAALEAAHEAGIVHRDLKPANIKVRTDGTVKVLDFGLAKAVDPSGSASGSLANSPTITSPATELGTILGTAAYMSPEQARGKAVDRRADVWAFGVVLFEMLTGRRAFQGTEVSDVLASVLKDTLPMDTLPADTPLPVRRLLRRCLAKDRSERLDSMGAARLEIADAQSPAAGEVSAPPPRSGSRLGWLVSAALIVAAAVIGAFAGTRLSRPGASAALPAQFVISARANTTTAVAITPDGATMVVESDRLYVRPLASAEMRPLAGTEGARNLFLSRDGQWVCFYQSGKIKKIALSGGDPLTIGEIDIDTPGAGWGPDDTVIYSAGWNSELFSIPADGSGKATAISSVNIAGGELGHWWPQTLPDGKRVLFTVWMAGSGINDSFIAVVDPATRTHRVLMPGAFARYVPSGHIVYFHAGSYHAVSVDPQTLQPRGAPFNVLDGVLPLDPGGGRQKPFDVSSGGTLVAIHGPLNPRVAFAWATAAGVVTPIDLEARAHLTADLTEDGRYVAASAVDGGVHKLWLYDLKRPTAQLIDLPGSNFAPDWSPDGRFFLFTAMRKGHFDVWQYLIDQGKAVPLIEEPFDQDPVTVSHDGLQFAMLDYLKDGSVRLAAARIDRPGERIPVANLTEVDEIRFSPDDRWIAMATSIAGRNEIRVYPWPGGIPGVDVSTRGGSDPLWPKTGSRIFYRRDDELVAATYAIAGNRFSIEREETLFRRPDFNLIGIGPDGRFLISIPTPGQDLDLRVVMNWMQQLSK